MMLKLKLQYFGHLMRRVDSLKRLWCWEGLGAGGKGDNRAWDGWMASLTQWTWIWVNSGSWWWTGRLACCSSWGRKESDKTEWLTWTELNWWVHWLNYNCCWWVLRKNYVHHPTCSSKHLAHFCLISITRRNTWHDPLFLFPGVLSIQNILKDQIPKCISKRKHPSMEK